jgi:hypothetical protein
MGATRVGPQARTEYLARMRERYQGSPKAKRGALLDEVVAVTGYHRKAAVRLLNRATPARPRGPRRGRPVRYGPGVVRALRAIWEAAGYPWSVRLRALIPTWLPWLQQRQRVSAQDATWLAKMSARQMDRVLAPVKRTLKKRQYGGTKPGTLLKHHIPIKTDRWDVQVPGFTEVDLVTHSGERADGEFAYTLNLTDIHTTWVESGAVLGKGQVRVCTQLDALRRQLPFALAGIDSDNGTEFINAHLVRYCATQQIQFTRGRPYKKDDNAHIEQKNWTHVRKLFGYVRYDTAEAVAAMNAVYADLRLLQNLFLPTVKLVRKERVGAKVRRVYDTPQTPLARVRACPTAHRIKVAALVRLQRALDPFDLRARIDAGLERVFALARSARPAASTSDASLVRGGRAVQPHRSATAPAGRLRRAGPRARPRQKRSLTDDEAA